MKEKIKIKGFEQFIKENGNKLPIETEKILKEKDWETQVSSYYLDDISSKSREIDLIASKNIEISDPFNYRNNTFLLTLFM